MSNKKEKVDRRKFLKMSAVGAAGGAAVMASKSVSADTRNISGKSGYRETELVKAYYLSTRF